MTSRTAKRRSRSSQQVAGKGRAARGPGLSMHGGRSPRRIAVVAIAIVCAAALVIIAAGILRDPQATPSTSSGDPAEAVRLVTNVPVAALDASPVGAGVSPPSRLAPGVPALTQDGKPEVLYVGAEYCPYCASQRWPLIVALSRFGTFNGLGLATSSSTDVFPDTPTFTFHGAEYSSEVLTFTGVEEATNTGAPLETPTTRVQALLQTYDAAPYTTSPGAIPFLMVGNRYVQIGASFPPDALVGRTQVEIASGLADPSADPAAADILGAANVMTAAICQLTGGAPSNVCQSPAVTRAAQTLPTQPPR